MGSIRRCNFSNKNTRKVLYEAHLESQFRCLVPFWNNRYVQSSSTKSRDILKSIQRILIWVTMKDSHRRNLQSGAGENNSGTKSSNNLNSTRITEDKCGTTNKP